jgi:hypothetical protein
MICVKQDTAEEPINAEIVLLNDDSVIFKLYFCQYIVVCYWKQVHTHAYLHSSSITEGPVQVKLCISWKWVLSSTAYIYI